MFVDRSYQNKKYIILLYYFVIVKLKLDSYH